MRKTRVWIALFPFQGHRIKNPPQISSGDRFSVQSRDTALKWIEMGKSIGDFMG